MGSACCVAAKSKEDLPISNSSNTSHRNVRCSPTWSFRWENRRRVAGEIDGSPYQTSHGLSRDASVEVKGPLGSDRGNLSDEVSLHDSYGTPVSLKSPVYEGMRVNLIAQASGNASHSQSCFILFSVMNGNMYWDVSHLIGSLLLDMT